MKGEHAERSSEHTPAATSSASPVVRKPGLRRPVLPATASQRSVAGPHVPHLGSGGAQAAGHPSGQAGGQKHHDQPGAHDAPTGWSAIESTDRQAVLPGPRRHCKPARKTSHLTDSLSGPPREPRSSPQRQYRGLLPRARQRSKRPDDPPLTELVTPHDHPTVTRPPIDGTTRGAPREPCDEKRRRRAKPASRHPVRPSVGQLMSESFSSTHAREHGDVSSAGQDQAGR